MLTTRDQRIALAELVNIVALLTESKVPNSKELACIVLLRFKTIVQDELPVVVLTHEDVGLWLQVARAIDKGES